ncbi:MAG: dephospho-CoA kinase [Planctomycetota bacterium]
MGTRVIGISGGVAAGKSTVARILAGLGAEVVDADAIGHEALKREDVKRRVVSKLGGEILDDRGEIDRRKLGAIVFSSPDRLNDLEAIVHPIILERIREQIRSASERAAKVVALDAALLYESGLDEICDGVVFVDADEKKRAARASGRGWTAEDCAGRERRQIKTADKRRRANWIVDNSGSLKELENQIRKIWQQILDRNT